MSGYWDSPAYARELRLVKTQNLPPSLRYGGQAGTLVGDAGLEPATSGTRILRATNCANLRLL